MSEPITKRSPVSILAAPIRTAKGYRIQSDKDATKFYDITVEHDRIVCLCPDFIKHKKDATYQCKHVVIALEAYRQEQSPDDGESEGSTGNEVHTQNIDEKALAAQQTVVYSRPAAPQMCIKRSISPDGRINALSIQIEFSLEGRDAEAIKAEALAAIRMQNEIMTNSFPEPEEPPVAAPTPQIIPIQPSQFAQAVPAAHLTTPVPARLTGIGVMTGKWGPRHFITVDVGGKTTKLFGSQKQLSEQIQAAGYAIPADQLREGMQLNLPCRVTTQPSADGRYLNIDRVFPAQ